MRRITRSAVAAALIGAVVAATAALGVVAQPAAAAPAPNGTLTLTNTTPAPGDPLTFSYTTDKPNTKNWIAVYNDPATGPTDEKSHGSSTDWAYASATTAASSGTVTVASTGLTPGHDLVAYFLYADGYTWLAQPVTFHVGYATGGSLALTTATPRVGGDLTFSYSTGDANASGTDWVAIYDDPKKSPLNQTYPGAGSTAWSYVSGTSGTVTIPAGALTSGHDVIAYLLADDGYTWLAQPVVFRLAPAASGPTDSGTLTLLTQDPIAGKPLTFSFTTATPNAKNWIGIYDDPATAPSGGASHGASTTWAYVPNATSGTVTIPAGALTGGHTVAAVLLYDDGYVNLAPPITFALKAEPPLTGSTEPTVDHFLTDDIVRPAAAPSTAVRFSVAGMWTGVRGAAPAAATFTAQGGPDWLAVAPDGTVTGTTPASIPAQTPLLTVLATEASGLTATLTIELPISEPGAPPAVHAATLSLWDGGTHVDDAVGKLARSVLVNRFDLIALQETGGNATAVAQRLGWNVVEDPTGLAVIAPFPLTALPAPAGAVLAVSAAIGGADLPVWDVALDAGGPDRAAVCTEAAAAAVSAEKASTRYAQAQAIARAARAAHASAPEGRLLLLGDLESPSDVDWVGAASAANCAAGPVAWPVTSELHAAGLVDAFRTARTDTAADPGATAGILGGTASAAAARPALLDRLDYAYVAGAMTVQDANLVIDGFPQASPSNANRWVSDRAAVEATIVLAAPPADGGGAGSGGGAAPADPGTSATAPHAGLPGALARTGDVLGLVMAGLAMAAVVIGALTILIRRRMDASTPSGIAAAEPNAHPEEAKS